MAAATIFNTAVPSSPWPFEMTSGRCLQTNDDFALSEALGSVRSVLLQHEPLSAAFLLLKLAEEMETQDVKISLRTWSEAVDSAALDRRMGSRCLAMLQNTLQKEVASRDWQEENKATSCLTETNSTSAEDSRRSQHGDRQPQPAKRLVMPPIMRQAQMVAQRAKRHVPDPPSAGSAAGSAASASFLRLVSDDAQSAADSLSAGWTCEGEIFPGNGTTGRNSWRAHALFASANNSQAQDAVDGDRCSFESLAQLRGESLNTEATHAPRDTFDVEQDDTRIVQGRAGQIVSAEDAPTNSMQ
eukprot:TRINITY_DN93298_c0_g1_i1.p1 TRINITY_DN93298_c0_g1~~TRINITY_DN93298_c0_g1_i1.p1  ORF type:complete len:300 (-),score=36.36 TRINITY_DN93298_c0_g1_i1:222-1121(-)